MIIIEITTAIIKKFRYENIFLTSFKVLTRVIIESITEGTKRIFSIVEESIIPKVNAIISVAIINILSLFFPR